MVASSKITPWLSLCGTCRIEQWAEGKADALVSAYEREDVSMIERLNSPVTLFGVAFGRF